MATVEVTDHKEFDEALKSTDTLVDESVQIYELETEKINVVDELYNSLNHITEFLGFYVDIPSNILNHNSDTKISLSPSLKIIIKHKNGKQDVKRLDELPLDQITLILKAIISPLIELIKKEKLLKNKNISFIRNVTKKLAKIDQINDTTNKTEETPSIDTNTDKIEQNN